VNGNTRNVVHDRRTTGLPAFFSVVLRSARDGKLRFRKGWPAAHRVRWFRTFAMNVSQIYDNEGEPVEMKIELKEAAN
jgi:hypothetical protein